MAVIDVEPNLSNLFKNNACEGEAAQSPHGASDGLRANGVGALAIFDASAVTLQSGQARLLRSCRSELRCRTPQPIAGPRMNKAAIVLEPSCASEMH
jgi:hypothetical protein